jgi:alpha-tubulin suppressor-like RCC1 family protein
VPADDRVPQRVQLRTSLSTPVSSVAVGAGFTCVVTETSDHGAAGCFGSNSQQALGRPACTATLSPCAFDFVTTTLRFASLSAAEGTVCGTTTDARVACWGNDYALQAGDPSGPFVSTPYLVNMPAPATKVVVSSTHACMLTTEPRVWCWGDMSYGGVFPTSTALSAFPRVVASQR